MMDWEIWLTATFQDHKKRKRQKSSVVSIKYISFLYNHTFENSLSEGVASWGTTIFKKPWKATSDLYYIPVLRQSPYFLVLSSESINKLTCGHISPFLVHKHVSSSGEISSNPYVLFLPCSSTLLISPSILPSKPSLLTGFSTSSQDIHFLLGCVTLHLLSSLSLFVILAPLFGRTVVTCDMLYLLYLLL